MSLMTGSSSSSQRSALATLSMLASMPSAAQSCSSGPLICAAVGALPEMARDFSTVIAASPAPPATAKSFQWWPLACSESFRPEMALASPPLVHQCSTSRSPARAGPASAPRVAIAAVASTARRVR